MKLIELNIQNCKRFNRFKNNNITLRPEKDIQIILGANGAGKSTLLEYIFPTTPNKKDFYDDGIRTVVYNVNGKIIKIVNTTRRHSFKVDGIELNKAGILKVQQQLIEQYFDLDKDTYNLITNKVSFSLLNERERREWIQRLSNIDFTEALEIYNKFMSLRRDTRGVIKHYQQQLANLTTVTEEDYRIKEREQTILSNRIQTLYSDRKGTNKVTTTEKYLNNLKQQLDELKTLIKPDMDVAILDALNKEQIILEQRVNKINSQGESPELLEKEIEALKETLRDLEYKDVSMVVNIPELDIAEDIITIVETSEEIRFNITRAVEVYNAYEDAIKEHARIESKLHEIEHIISGDKQICPSCKTVFITNQDKTVDELTIMSNHYKLALQDLKTNIDRLRENAEATDKVIKSVDNVFRVLHPYNKYLNITKDDLIRNPLSIQEQLNEIRNNQHEQEKQTKINSKITELKHQIELLESKRQITKDYIYESVEDVMLLIKDVRDRITTFHRNKELNAKFVRLQEQYRIESKQLPLIEENKQTEEINKSLDIELGQIKREHATLSAELNKMNNDLVIKNNITKKLSYEVTKADDLDKLIKALNPKTGLISRAITDTIDGILNLINNFIQKIWSEEMVIVRDTNNPYIFNIKRNGQTTEDIRLGSSGMRSVIDVAFRIVALRNLNQTDMFVLDEFGADLDVIHRAKALELIDTLPSFDFKNVYVVTHFMDNGYKLKSNTELIEL